MKTGITTYSTYVFSRRTPGNAVADHPHSWGKVMEKREHLGGVSVGLIQTFVLGENCVLTEQAG